MYLDISKNWYRKKEIQIIVIRRAAFGCYIMTTQGLIRTFSSTANIPNM
jgi:hypothetical protein